MHTGTIFSTTVGGTENDARKVIKTNGLGKLDSSLYPVLFQESATAPTTTGSLGFWWDSSTGTPKFWDGFSWSPLGV